ncbi:phospholipase/carboxylesterase [Filimonas zeae]|uniref:Phospholipase/carboxylesterase n=2 Tax=Filimonas zeae TaxID=1737353 RepID=A0A917IQW1_9BACT|nr:phospholipase/carboxylesterase [Filimonas zeae]
MKRKTLLSLIIIVTITITSFMIPTSKEAPALHYLVRKPKVAATHPPLIILLHGVGSNEQNMFSMANSLPDKYLVVSARGPLTLGLNSFAWFQVDFSSGKPVIIKEQAEQARVSIIRFIDDLKKVEQFNDQEVFLMGFSQGGIMSYSVALTEPEKIKGIVVMSGRLLPEIKPLVVSEERLKPLKIFVSHGTNDRVLQFQYALDAVDYLKTKGLHPDFHQYNEDHTINTQMLNDVAGWLNK